MSNQDRGGIEVGDVLSLESNFTYEKALDIMDTYLSDCDSIMSRERKNRMIHAMGLLLPKSDFAKRNYE